ncbi:MAG: zinc ribbon domain-containing protein [Nanoarchaeota archaeon]|nr:zinc ribbon domain-containing protein [Nanoarchaeota archaeon]MBU1052002.1 zinc ribbon domain-containing protein [Nanoarchaeota archaeon]MBU1988717.1 zinc ribbon domain-containing protein [Nanoarchaeota archaeon]
MLFDKKNKNQRKCEECGARSEEKFSFCPHCGNNFVDSRKEREDFGLLGKNDFEDYEEEIPMQGFGVMDKLVGSMINSMMKNFDKQFKSQVKDIDRDLERAEVRTFPNGISIKISGPFDAQGRSIRKQQKKKIVKREISEEQLKKISSLPRAKAKANVKRFSDRVVYELFTPGVCSAEDVFVSKLENGYEIKAIGDKKVYVNSVPINLPLRKYSILKNKLLVEFLAGGQTEESKFLR